MSDPDPRRVWREKLKYLQTEEAKASDPSQKFQIQQEINEAREKLAALDGDDSDLPDAGSLVPSGSENPSNVVGRSTLTSWQMLGLFLAIAVLGAGTYFINPIVSFVFLALAMAVGTFGFLNAAAIVENRWGRFGGSAAMAVATLLILLQWGPVPVHPSQVSVAGMVYVDDRPATAGTVRLLGTQLADNTRNLTDGNPGHFEFKGLRDIGDRVELDIDVDAPLDLPATTRDFAFLPEERIEVRLQSASARPTLPPSLTGATEPLKDQFVGRVEELSELDDAWDRVVQGESRTVAVLAWGGFGKTALVRQWLWQRFGDDEWRGADAPEATFWQTFQDGAGVEPFVLDLISYFSQSDVPSLTDMPTPRQQIARFQTAIGDRRYLLVLDGLEVEQDETRGDSLGRLKQPFLTDLLKMHTAGQLGNGLCVITSRLPIGDLAGPAFEEPFRVLNLEKRPLGDAEVRRLLELEGVEHCSDTELQELIGITGRHPLALETIGRILAQHNDGRAADWQKFDSDVFDVPEGREAERRLWRIFGWTDRLIDDSERHVMTVVGHFRGPVHQAWLTRLFVPSEAPPVPSGLEPKLEAVVRDLKPIVQEFDAASVGSETEANAEQRMRAMLADVPGNTWEQLVTMARSDWKPVSTDELAVTAEQRMSGPELRRSLDALVKLQLLRRDKDRYAMHGLVRQHFRRRAARDNPELPAELHRRLYRLYTSVIQPTYLPDTLEELRPLYEAVYHGCQAGLHTESRNVYRDRIMRGTGSDGFYSSKQLGAIDADLGAVACFFTRPWTELSQNVSGADQAWLLNSAGSFLRAQGRLTEAVEPMHAAVKMAIKHEDWINAAIYAGNVSELELTLGEASAAVASARESVTLADKSGFANQRTVNRTTLGNALFQRGVKGEGRGFHSSPLKFFEEAEALQSEHQPQYRGLYSLPGFQYCELLLSGAEHAAWQAMLDRKSEITDRENQIAACVHVTERAIQALEIAQTNNLSLLTTALDHLTLSRAALYRELLTSAAKSSRVTLDPSSVPIDAAVVGLRATGDVMHLPRGLLTRAWCRSLTGDVGGAAADLDEAWDIAETGPMPLYQADILLTHARLRLSGRDLPLPDPAQHPAFQTPATALAEARRLINKHGYHRRGPELADAEAALHGATSAP